MFFILHYICNVQQYGCNKNIGARCYLCTLFVIVLSFITNGLRASCKRELMFNDTLKEIIVTPRFAQYEIIPPQKLKGKDLERLNSQSIADALRYFTGLQIKDYGGVGGMKTVNIRALGSQHVGIAYDGIMLSNAQNGQIDLGQFSLDNVDEITIYNGQKSYIFQSATDFGNAGTIYIHTHSPRFLKNKCYNLKVKTKFGSSNTFRFSTIWEQRILPNVSTSLNAELLSSNGKYKFHHNIVSLDGYTTHDTLAIRQNGDILAERIEINMYGLIKKGFWNAKGYFYNSSRGIPGAIVENVWHRGERQSDLNSFFQGRFQKDITNKFSTKVLAKYAFYYTHYLNKDPYTLPIDNKYWQQEAYFSIANIYEILPSWHASIAYDFKWNKLNANTAYFAFPTRNSHLTSIATSLNMHYIKAQASLLMTNIEDKVNFKTFKKEDPKTFRKFSPAIFLNFPILTREDNINKKRSMLLNINAFAKQHFRMPTFNDLYYTDIGSSDLKPERANQYNIGASFDYNWLHSWAKNIHLRIDTYYNTINNKIVAFPKGQQFRWTILNLGKVDIKGLDISSAFTFTANHNIAIPLLITSRIQYTYQQAKDITSVTSSFYKNQIPYIPKHSGSFVLNLDYAHFSVNYSLIYTGQRYSGKNNTIYTRMHAWLTHDANISYFFKYKKMVWKVIVEANNIFNQQYEVVDNYPMPGFNGNIGIQVEL